jgi:cysteine desulfurase
MEGFPEAFPFYKEGNRLPHVTAMAFPGVVNEALLYALNQNGLYASIGGGTSQKLALILQASGVAESLAQSAISFSLSRETHEDDIEKAAEIVVEAAKKLARTSHHLRAP